MCESIRSIITRRLITGEHVQNNVDMCTRSNVELTQIVNSTGTEATVLTVWCTV